MDRNVTMKYIWGSFLILALCSFPRTSHADWSIGFGFGDNDRDHHDWREHEHHEWREHEHHEWQEHRYFWHEHPHWGLHIHNLPFTCDTVWEGFNRYYYCDGLYYTYGGYGDYVLVEPPQGAYVDQIPGDFRPVLINGAMYYTDNGTYYVATSRGYRVVVPPVVYQQPVVVQPAAEIAPAPVPASSGTTVPMDGDSFPVNVPNNTGGYTTVVIKKSGSGYVGPQGEYYAGFPTVAQLKAMYVK